VPLYLMFRQFGLLDKYTGLILVYSVFTIPIVVWLMLGYVEAAPRELEEAAYVDGASYWTAFRRIALPILAPGLAVAAVFTFIFTGTNTCLPTNSLATTLPPSPSICRVCAAPSPNSTARSPPPRCGR
jgi:ABC-type glycerol-3-phosphate transport system permease component